MGASSTKQLDETGMPHDLSDAEVCTVVKRSSFSFSIAILIRLVKDRRKACGGDQLQSCEMSTSLRNSISDNTTPTSIRVSSACIPVDFFVPDIYPLYLNFKAICIKYVSCLSVHYFSR